MQNPEDINNVVDYLLANMDAAQDIATKGQNMVLMNHSITARIMQLKNAVDIINDAEREFKGAGWCKGEFVVF